MTLKMLKAIGLSTLTIALSTFLGIGVGLIKLSAFLKQGFDPFACVNFNVQINDSTPPPTFTISKTYNLNCTDALITPVENGGIYGLVAGASVTCVALGLGLTFDYYRNRKKEREKRQQNHQEENNSDTNDIGNSISV